MISAKDVANLRERTGAGMMDCKKALTEAAGDMEKAVDLLREKGLAAAAKKAGRVAAEGVVEAYIAADAKVGVIVEVNCETDFVAKTDEYKAFCAEIAQVIAEQAPADVEALSALQVNGQSVADYLTAKIAKIGENISIRRFARFAAAAGVVDAYIHGGGRIGVLIEVGCDNAAACDNAELKTFCRDMAMQVAAANPEFIKRDDVPAEVVEREKNIARTKAINEGKPEKILDKIVDGSLEKYYKEFCMLEQVYIKENDQTVQKHLAKTASSVGAALSLNNFARFMVGEGIEKKQSNLAEEVAAMSAGH
ncbi:MAG: translation elongation factor Ts [Bacillota bacterium]|nr:translation elongation factor Ts [Bacillota bacterium]